MANADSSVEALVAELAELRATLTTQQATIARQEAAIAALQHGAMPELSDHLASSATAVTADEAMNETSDSGERRGLTSRRGLLRGAAATAAAATVASVALGAGQQAHAAPAVANTTGGAFILGAANDADAITSLANTPSTSPMSTLKVSTDVVNLANFAITTNTAGATGIYADETNDGIGIQGNADSTLGLGIGVWGTSTIGWGVVGSSAGGIDLGATGSGTLYLQPQSAPGAPTSGSWVPGIAVIDSNGELWLCVVSGTPGKWVKVAHLAPGATSGGAITYLSKPIRLFDSRPGATALFHPGTICKAGTSTLVQVAGDSYNGVTVPATLAGAIGNVTVLDGSGAGFVEIVPSGAGFTGAANLAFSPGQIVSNSFNVGLSSGGALDIYVGSSNADVIIDLFAVVA